MNIDLGIVCIYLVATIVIGLLAGRNVKTMRDFSVSSGTFSTTALVMTIFTTFMGGGDLIGVSERTFTIGAAFILVISLANLSKLVITANIIAPKIVSDFSDKISIGEIMGTLYGKVGQLVCGLASVLFHIGYIAIQVSSMGYVCNILLGITYGYGCIIGSLIIIAYSTAGGIRSVVFTDILQFFVLLVGIPLIGSVVLGRVGGFSGLACRLPVAHLSIINIPYDAFVYCVIFFIVDSFPNFNPYQEQRMLMAKDSAQAKKSFLIAGILCVPFYILVSLIGLCALLIFPSGDPNHAFLNAITFSLPTVLKGIAISGVLAVIMSTADSLLNVAAISARDVYNALMSRKLDDYKELSLAKVSTVVLGCLSIFVAVSFHNLVDLWLFIINFWTPIISPPLFLYVLFNIKTSVRAYIISASIGICSILIYRYSVPEVYKALSPVIGMLVAMVAMLILYKIESKPEAAERTRGALKNA